MHGNENLVMNTNTVLTGHIHIVALMLLYYWDTLGNTVQDTTWQHACELTKNSQILNSSKYLS